MTNCLKQVNLEKLPFNASYWRAAPFIPLTDTQLPNSDPWPQTAVKTALSSAEK